MTSSEMGSSPFPQRRKFTKIMYIIKLPVYFTSQRDAMKVAVLGASGGIGQPLALLLKSNPLITQLSLFDIVHTPGVAADLSHICSPAQVTGFMGNDQLEPALTGSDVVVIPAGVPRKPGE